MSSLVSCNSRQQSYVLKICVYTCTTFCVSCPSPCQASFRPLPLALKSCVPPTSSAACCLVRSLSLFVGLGTAKQLFKTVALLTISEVISTLSLFGMGKAHLRICCTDMNLDHWCQRILKSSSEWLVPHWAHAISTCCELRSEKPV